MSVVFVCNVVKLLLTSVICVCMFDVIVVKNGNFEYGTVFKVPATTKLLACVVVKVPLL